MMQNDTSLPTTSQPNPKKGLTSRLSLGAWLPTVIAVGIIVLILQILADAQVVTKLLLPKPTDVWKALISGFENGTLGPHVLATTWATTVGFVTAAIAAVIIAGILVALPTLERSIMPIFVALQVLPKVALAPLFVVALGFGLASKVAIIGVICFFPMLINSLEGLRVRSREHAEVFQWLDASPWQTFRYLRLPGAVPFVFAGLRVGAVFALIGAVIAEFVGSDSGLGYNILQSTANFDTAAVWACLVLLMIIGLAFHFAVVFCEKRFIFWSVEQVR
jgi:NitT/TauT family transport system permease protein